MAFIYKGIKKKLKGEDKQKEERKELVKQGPTELEKICQDPKYYHNLTDEDKKNLTNVQQNLAFELSRLDFEGALNERKTMDDLLQEAKLYEESGKKFDAANLYRKAATLGLLKQDLRAKVDPKAALVDLKNVRTYLKKANELGWPISYGTIITYTEIAREIASNHLTGYQPKTVETKPESEKPTVQSLKK